MRTNKFNKNILITGSSGFIGSHLFDHFQKKGKNILGISRKPKRRSEIKGDVTNFRFIDDVVKKHNIDTIFHLASQSLVDLGTNNPRKTFETNLRGTTNILEASRTNKIKRVIIASTAHVYGDGGNNLPYKETDPIFSTRPYETSKVCADLIAQSYRFTFSLPVFIPRFVNVYGPGDINFSRIIPRTIKSILENKNPQIWGGKAARDFLFISDALRAYLLLADKIDNPRDNGLYNFGVGKPINVIKLVQKIINLSSKQLFVKITPAEREKEIKEQYVSFRKAKKELGWDAKVSLDFGLKKTWKWYSRRSSINDILEELE